MRTIHAVMLALVGAIPCFAADETPSDPDQRQAAIDNILSSEAVVPSRVVYKKAPAEVNRKAIEKLQKTFLAPDAKELPDDLLPLTMVCGGGLWQNIKDDDEMQKVEGGQAQLKVLTDQGGMAPTEGKLFQKKDDLAAFWRAFRRKYDLSSQSTIRRPTSVELDVYWSMIPFDITEPIFIIENKQAKILTHFTEKELQIAWIDDLKDMPFKQMKTKPSSEATATNVAPTLKEKRPMPIYVTPFYNSQGPKVAVGKYSKRLAEANADSILPLVAELEKDQHKLRAEVMYVTAVRLFDLGHKDEAVEWFYRAQFRARVFSALLDPKKMGAIGSEAFELKQAYGAFNQLAGSPINVYAFGYLDKLEKALRKVIEDGESLPNFAEIYPNVVFLPTEEWAAKSKEVSSGLAKLISYIQTNADAIREQREKNGVGK